MLNAKKIYKDYDKKVIEYMDNLIKRLTNQYGLVNEEWRVSLDLIAFNYDLICKCQEDLAKNGMNVNNSRGVLMRNPSLSTINSAQCNLMRLLNSFGLNIASKSRIGKVDADNDEALIDNLLG